MWTSKPRSGGRWRHSLNLEQQCSACNKLFGNCKRCNETGLHVDWPKYISNIASRGFVSISWASCSYKKIKRFIRMISCVEKALIRADDLAQRRVHSDHFKHFVMCMCACGCVYVSVIKRKPMAQSSTMRRRLLIWGSKGRGWRTQGRYSLHISGLSPNPR